KAYEALTRPAREALARLEEPYRRDLRAKKLARIAEAARQAHETPEDQRTVEQKDLVEQTLRFLVVSTKEVRTAMIAGDRQKAEALDDELIALAPKQPAPLPAALGIVDGSGQPPKTFLLERGELK